MVAEDTDKFDTVMFGPACIVAPEAKPFPVMVTGVDTPTSPFEGSMLLILGVTVTVAWEIPSQILALTL